MGKENTAFCTIGANSAILWIWQWNDSGYKILMDNAANPPKTPRRLKPRASISKASVRKLIRKYNELASAEEGFPYIPSRLEMCGGDGVSIRTYIGCIREPNRLFAVCQDQILEDIKNYVSRPAVTTMDSYLFWLAKFFRDFIDDGQFAVRTFSHQLWHNMFEPLMGFIIEERTDGNDPAIGDMFEDLVDEFARTVSRWAQHNFDYILEDAVIKLFKYYIGRHTDGGAYLSDKWGMLQARLKAFGDDDDKNR